MANKWAVSIGKGFGVIAVIIIAILFMAFVVNQDYSETIPTKISLPSDTDIVKLENAIHQHTNIERNKVGISELSSDSILNKIAKNHSTNMAKNDFFSHDDLYGFGPTERGKQLSYECVKVDGQYITEGIGENISKQPQNLWRDEDFMAKEIVNAWMESQGHRENILNKDYDKLGIGVAISEDGWILSTQNFC